MLMLMLPPDEQEEQKQGVQGFKMISLTGLTEERLSAVPPC